MRDQCLVDLNFREIIDYGGQPSIEHRRAKPQPCHGYCLSCEESGLLSEIGGHLDLMSHGCDAEDFTTILGPMPFSDDGHDSIDQPVLFLLEDPGGESGRDYGISARVPFRGFAKRPPVWQYFWSPNGEGWPTQIEEFDGNWYGAYFAYLMRRHQLRDVYITNLTKCKWIPDTNSLTKSGDKSRLITHCAERYLTREVRIFAPRIAFCFGEAAKNGLEERAVNLGLKRNSVVYLYHPSYIRNRWQTGKRTQEQLRQRNDAWVTQALVDAGLRGNRPYGGAKLDGRAKSHAGRSDIGHDMPGTPRTETSAMCTSVQNPEDAYTQYSDVAEKLRQPAESALIPNFRIIKRSHQKADSEKEKYNGWLFRIEENRTGYGICASFTCNWHSGPPRIWLYLHHQKGRCNTADWGEEGYDQRKCDTIRRICALLAAARSRAYDVVGIMDRNNQDIGFWMKMVDGDFQRVLREPDVLASFFRCCCEDLAAAIQHTQRG